MMSLAEFLSAVRPHSQGPTLLDDVPNPIGAELANNGEFGYVEPKEHELKSRRRYPRTFGDRLFRREMSYVKYPPSTFTKNMIPHAVDRSYIPFLARNYSGQFSEDGSFFFTASQDFKVRMFDTSNHDFPWKLYKTVHVEMARWTVTDASLSNDNRFIAYSSIAPTVHLASTSPDDEGGQEALDFGEGLDNIHRGFGIWSLRFSADGREIVAGANNCCLYVYDIETKKTILRLTGHEDEVNAVCFGDESGNILYSGSDDQVIKVWDRRSMGYKQEAGVLLGHVEGITYIDSKKDGRYLLSNGKDQTMKLWDIRKLMSSSEFSGMANRNYSSQFDYRYQRFPRPVGTRHPRDCSVMTYAGHHVLRTLIRCHFGPASATGSQYVYSGSSNGKVHIWSLDGQVVQTLNARLQGEPSGPSVRGFNRHQSAAPCVRDASWHPYLPIIATSSWDGFSNEEGSVMLHRWRDRTGDTLEGEDNAVMQAASIPDYGETYYDGSYDYF
ncbi:WD40-repeat-containing domain protein [Myxozyma melibiosi]|uniref:WD40-repeat-containing domain protein n=1 Tax=Myxozyma melibiosi TaxID=54550 RepID=A0ABR1F1H9_9ASCO